MSSKHKNNEIDKSKEADGGKLSQKMLESLLKPKNLKYTENKDYLKKYMEKSVGLNRGSNLARLDQPYQFTFKKPAKPVPSAEELYHKRRLLSGKQKRELGIYKLDKESLNYQSLIPLNDLWKGYIKHLITGKNDLGAALIKADLHGAIITVTQTKNIAIFGISGIVVYETLNTFQIVTEDNKYKSLPKQGTKFTIEVEGTAYHLLGNNLIVRPHDKATKKFKSKPSIEL